MGDNIRVGKMRLVVICLFITLVSAVPQSHLHQQEQENNQLNPVNDAAAQEEAARLQKKRTLFGPTILGHTKHVGIHPLGFKYLLGYGPIGYYPYSKPITVLKPVVHTSGWKPVFSTANVPVFKPIKPVVPVVPVKPHIHTIQPVVPAETVPIQPVVPFEKPAEEPVVKPVFHIQHAPEPIVPITPAVKPLIYQHQVPAVYPFYKPLINPLLHNPPIVTPLVAQPPVVHQHPVVHPVIPQPQLVHHVAPQPPVFHNVVPQPPVFHHVVPQPQLVHQVVPQHPVFHHAVPQPPVIHPVAPQPHLHPIFPQPAPAVIPQPVVPQQVIPPALFHILKQLPQVPVFKHATPLFPVPPPAELPGVPVPPVVHDNGVPVQIPSHQPEHPHFPPNIPQVPFHPESDQDVHVQYPPPDFHTTQEGHADNPVLIPQPHIPNNPNPQIPLYLPPHPVFRPGVANPVGPIEPTNSVHTEFSATFPKHPLIPGIQHPSISLEPPYGPAQIGININKH